MAACKDLNAPMPDIEPDPLSIIAARPPQLSSATAIELVSQHYGLDVECRSLVSERDQNFHLITPDRRQFVLKIANAAEDRVPQQTCSDWAYLCAMAGRHGHKVFLDPGPVPGVSQLYFGPVPRPGLPQKPISVNLGPMSDAYDVNVEHDGETLTAARAKVHDRPTGQVTELQIPTSTNTPQSLLADPTWPRP